MPDCNAPQTLSEGYYTKKSREAIFYKNTPPVFDLSECFFMILAKMMVFEQNWLFCLEIEFQRCWSSIFILFTNFKLDC